ncbi:hypothetical protein BN1263410013 [Stenotrophomonas thermophila]|nr:hypothetical protein BN1263410013 [Stenotrophomonas maltophilia]
MAPSMAPTVPASPSPRHRTVSCERGQHFSAPVRFEKRVLVVPAAGRQPDLAGMPASGRHYHFARAVLQEESKRRTRTHLNPAP